MCCEISSYESLSMGYGPVATVYITSYLRATDQKLLEKYLDIHSKLVFYEEGPFEKFASSENWLPNF